jgi:hypothetical protein
MALPGDTSPAAWERYMDGMRRTSPQDRVRRAVEMSDELRHITRAGIRSRHPQWTPEQVQDELEDLMLGTDLARAARSARRSGS